MSYRLGSLALLVVLALPAEAAAIRQLTDTKTDGFVSYAVDDAGTVLVALSKSDPFGTNPDHAYQIFKWNLPGGGGTQITNFPGGLGSEFQYISLSDDGLTLTFSSFSDPTGQNPDGSRELFLMQSDGTGLVQLTDVGPADGYVASPVLSGSGNRVLFTGTIDPLGTNPGHLWELFVLDTGTLALTQLTQSTEGFLGGFSISDDGTRVVFGHSGDLLGADPLDETSDYFKVDADGQNLAQLTTSSTDYWMDPVISGNGQIVVFEVEGQGIEWMTWTGAGPAPLIAGSDPSITDDGVWIYVSGGPTKISRSGGGPVALTSFGGSHPVVAGSNSRVVFTTFAEPPGFDNPDLGAEIAVVDSDGSNLAQVTNDDSSIEASVTEVEITPDGTRIVFKVSNPHSLSRIQADGSDSTVVTTAGNHPTITADGNTIVFRKADELGGTCTGQNTAMIFRIQADGTGETLLSEPCGTTEHNALAADGSTVVYQSVSDGNGLYSVPGGGGTPTEFASDGSFLRKYPALSSDGVWAVWQSDDDFGGANPNERIQIFRGRTDGTFVEMLTADPNENAARPDVSADGRYVVFEWSGDPLGTNPENNREIYLYDVVTLTMQQLTTTGASVEARISDDGAWVYFKSGAPIFGPEPGNLYRVRVSTGVVERAGGRARVSGSGRDQTWLAVNGDGSVLTFASLSDVNGGNADLSRELWVADFNAPSAPVPAPDGSGHLEWDADPRAVRYDVIRGDVANLAPGAGGTVDLGAVVCLEDDSGDTNTLGFEDADEPSEGQVFFFVYRGSQGVAAGPGSYGEGTGGERIPSSGDCSP